MNKETNEYIKTEKLASRVGASLLKAAYIPKLIAPTMFEYEKIMMDCVRNENNWFEDLKNQLLVRRDSCPLFDTQRWVENLGKCLYYPYL